MIIIRFLLDLILTGIKSAADQKTISSANSKETKKKQIGTESESIMELLSRLDRGKGASECSRSFGNVFDFLTQFGIRITRWCVNTPIYPSMAIAQAAIESGWGAQSGKTLYGVKAAGWDGPTIDLLTKENRAGELKSETHRFRAYDTYDASIRDYIRVLRTAPWFRDVCRAQTVEDAVRGLQNDKNPEWDRLKKYATDRTYEKKVLSIINDFGLKYYDKLRQQAESIA